MLNISSEMRHTLKWFARSIDRKTVRRCLSHSLRAHISNIGNVSRRREWKELLKNKVYFTAEEKKTAEYLKKNPYKMFGYDGINDYDLIEERAVRDAKSGLCYVPFEGKRLFFRRFTSEYEASGCFNELSAEMDIRSPHRYVTSENKIIGTVARPEESECKGFYVKTGDVVADIGCAEGNFSISIADVASHIYLFESNPDWIEALEHTFKDYRHKITIVNKYVSDRNTDTTITLDTFFKDKKINFIKADIEGHEENMLNGAKELLSSRKDLKLSVCTYHRADDYNKFEEFFHKLGYKTSSTAGLMFLNYNGSQPYLRRGVIRAVRSN